MSRNVKLYDARWFDIQTPYTFTTMNIRYELTGANQVFISTSTLDPFEYLDDLPNLIKCMGIRNLDHQDVIDVNFFIPVVHLHLVIVFVLSFCFDFRENSK